MMELYGLLKETPMTSLSEIEKALNKHLCCCTGYKQNRDKALMVKKLIQKKVINI